MQIRTLDTPGLGNRTYVLTDGSSAAVIDPQRDLDLLEDLLEGLRVTHVFETHVHNDYVSGGWALAKATGAEYHLHADDEVAFDRVGLRDRDRIRVGDLTLEARHTPGHTPTHLSYVLLDEAGEHRAVFTGGSMLYGTVGRTDLLGASLADGLTRSQHASVRGLARDLAEDVTVHPTHGFGSFCSSSPGESRTRGTIGDERAGNLACRIDDEDEFVTRILGGLDAHPAYYGHMAPRNRLGAVAVHRGPAPTATPDELAQRMEQGEWVVDVRPRRSFAAEHLAGTINIGVDDSFATHLGWLIPWGTPVTLLGEDASQVASAQRALSRIGIDRPAASVVGPIDEVAGELPRSNHQVTDFAALMSRRRVSEPVVLDVRRTDERREAFLDGSIHVPLQELADRVDEVPRGEVWVHCQSGYRAAIAASLLARAGRTPVLVDDEFNPARLQDVAA